MGLAGTMLANSLLSGAQSVIQDLVTGDTSNTINKMWTSMGIGMLTSFLPGGYNGKKMSGIFNTSTAYIVSSNSAKKVAMYQTKQKLVKKTILKQAAKYIGSTTANDFGSWALDLLIGW